MNGHSVSISSLSGNNCSGELNAYLNVDERAYNGIGVWGSCLAPTYLLKRDQEFRLMQFGNQACANEWFEEHPYDGYEVIKLDPNLSIVEIKR